MATIVTITQVGAGQVVVPAGTKRATIEVWGGGAGGSYEVGGGGGGFSRINAIAVTPGDIIPYFVGAGGGSSSGGQASWFGGYNIVRARGGSVRKGGLATHGVGGVVYSGADGSATAGGASASPLGSGSGPASASADQGAGGGWNANGTAPGGGGGYNANLGGRGQIRITFDEIEGGVVVGPWTQTITLITTGLGDWQVPANVRVIETVEVWGAGAGAGGNGTIGGGGGGYSRSSKIAVPEGGLVPYFIGNGGAFSSPGQATWFGSRDLVRAKGGSLINGAIPAHGVGDVTYGGSNGVGGGGGAAGTPYGAPTSRVFLGDAHDEDGGAGAYPSWRSSGSAPGGGGGYDSDGGPGARGQIRLTYALNTTPGDQVKSVPFTKTVVVGSAGAGTWTAPTGAIRIKSVECWGGGSAWTGGGGGYSAVFDLPINGGIPYSVGGAGGDTWFGSVSTVLAKGGGATGGKSSSGVGSVKYSGGDYATYGGGSATPYGNAAGPIAIGPLGSSDEDGGSAANNGWGQPGGRPGGSGNNDTGGGGPGQIRITYVVYEPVLLIPPVQFSAFGGFAFTGQAALAHASVYPAATSSFATSAYGPYATAREGQQPTVSQFHWIGQYKSAPTTFEINQVMLGFDLSSIPNRRISRATLTLPVEESYGVNLIEARVHDWTAATASSFVPGSALASKPLLGTVTVSAGQIGQISFDLTDLPRVGLLKMVLASADQRTGTEPAGDDTTLLINGAAKLVLEFAETLPDPVAMAVAGGFAFTTAATVVRTVPSFPMTATGGFTFTASATVATTPPVYALSVASGFAFTAEATVNHTVPTFSTAVDGGFAFTAQTGLNDIAPTYPLTTNAGFGFTASATVATTAPIFPVAINSGVAFTAQAAVATTAPEGVSIDAGFAFVAEAAISHTPPTYTADIAAGFAFTGQAAMTYEQAVRSLAIDSGFAFSALAEVTATEPAYPVAIEAGFSFTAEATVINIQPVYPAVIETGFAFTAQATVVHISPTNVMEVGAGFGFTATAAIDHNPPIFVAAIHGGFAFTAQMDVAHIRPTFMAEIDTGFAFTAEAALASPHLYVDPRRLIMVPADHRAVRVPVDVRYVAVAADARRVSVPADTRSVGVPEDARSVK